MKIQTNSFFLALVAIVDMLLCSCAHGATFTLDALQNCVAEVRQAKVQQIVIDGKQAEVWVKLPDNPAPHSLINYVSGTGLFIQNDKNSFYFVTAAHVAHDMDTTAEVIMREGKDVPLNVPLAQLVGKGSGKWFYHPTADVAIIELLMEPDFFNQHMQHRCFPLASVNQELSAPSRINQLTVIGFPLGYGVEKFFSPLTQHSLAASGLLTLPRLDTQQKTEFFLLENPSIGGYSGAPCFDLGVYELGSMSTSTGTGTVLHGLVHGTQGDATGGKLALIVPGYFILDTIKKYQESVDSVNAKH